MDRNMSFTDQGTRVVIGAALLFAAAFDAIGPWGFIGIIPVITGIFGRCPAYGIFGISSRSPKDVD
jgi:hypothetical protein